MKYLFSLSFVFISIFLSAQVTIYDKNNEETKESSSYQKKSSSTYKLKVDLEDALAIGTGMIYGEKSFTDKFGLEVGVGITYISFVNAYMYTLSGKNVGQSSSYSIFLGEAESTNKAGVGVDDVFFPATGKIKYKPGFAISVSPKLYLEDDPTEGYFIGVQAQFKNYNFETPTALDVTKYNSQSFNKFNLSFNFGNTVNFSDNFVMETYMGIGVAIVNDVRNAYYNPGSGSSYNDIKVTFSPTRLHYQTGLRMCYVF
jgi:hypothetical protein